MPQIQIESKTAIKDLNEIIDTFNKMRQSITGIGDGSKASFRKMETSLKGLRSVQVDVLDAVEKLQKAYKNTLTSQKSFVTQTRNLKKELKSTQEELKRLENRLDSIKKKKGVFSGIATNVKSILAAFGLMQGVQMFANAIKSAFTLTKRLDSLAFSMKAVITDSEELGKTEAWLERITEDFGAELVTTTNRYIKFRAAAKQAGLTALETQKIFATMTKASGVLGLATHELQGVYLALEQMISKGKITTEELRRQLGERLPGAMDIMANSMGVTTAVLDDMLKKGEVITKDVLPAFAEQVNIAFGLDSVTRVETLQAATSRLQNAWTNLIKDFSEAQGISKLLMVAIDGIAKNLKAIVTVITAVTLGFVTYKVVVLTVTAIKQGLILVTKLLTKAYWDEIKANRIAAEVSAADAVAKTVQTGATVSLATATKALITQLRILTIAMLANPVTWIIGALGVLVGVILALRDASLEDAKAQQKLNDAKLRDIQLTTEQNQENRLLLQRYNELKDITQRNTEEQKELDKIIVKLGANIPVAKEAVDQYGKALDVNSEKAAEFIRLNKEINDLEANIVLKSETEILDETLEKLERLEGARKGLNTTWVNGVGQILMREGELGTLVDGVFLKLDDTSNLAVLSLEAKLKGIIEAAKGTIESINTNFKTEADDPTGEIRNANESNEKQLIQDEKDEITEKGKETVKWIDEEITALKNKQKEQQTSLFFQGTQAEKDQAIAEANEKINIQIEKLEARRNLMLGIRPALHGKSIKQLRIIRDLTLDIINMGIKKKVLELDVVVNDSNANVDDRGSAAKKSSQLQKQLAQSTYNIQAKIIDNKAQKEIDAAQKEIDLSTTTSARKIELIKHIEGIENEARQNKILKEGERALEQYQIEKTLQDKLTALRQERNAFEVEEEDNPFVQRAIDAKASFNLEVGIANARIKKAEEEFAISNKGLAARKTRDKEISEAKKAQTEAEINLAQELADVEMSMENAIIDLKIKHWQKELEMTSVMNHERRAAIEGFIQDLENSRPTVGVTDENSDIDDWKEHFAKILDLAGEFSNAIGNLAGAIFDANIERIEAEIQATEDKYDRLIELEEGNEGNQKVLRRNKEVEIQKLEKKRLKEVQKKKKVEKAQALVDIAINTAVGVSAVTKEGFLGLSLIPVIIALGALQAAAVLAAPIPKYKDGLDRADRDHVGMINDGGSQEYIGRGNQILTTEKKNALVPLKTGDTVYKNYDELSKKTMMMSGLYGGVQIKEADFNSMFFGLSKEIEQGFKKAKINNQITLKGFDPVQSAYRDRMSNWN